MAVIFEQVDGHRPASEQDVTQLEMALAAVLPADYREFLLQHNGGYPKPSGFCNGQEVLSSFFGFCEKNNCLWCNYYSTRTVLPPDVIPIGGDPFGNLICLAMRKREATWISQLYLTGLGRAASPGEVTNFVGALNAGYSRSVFVNMVVTSPEYFNQIID